MPERTCWRCLHLGLWGFIFPVLAIFLCNRSGMSVFVFPFVSGTFLWLKSNDIVLKKWNFFILRACVWFCLWKQDFWLLGKCFFYFLHTVFLIKNADRISYTLHVYAINGEKFLSNTISWEIAKLLFCILFRIKNISEE